MQRILTLCTVLFLASTNHAQFTLRNDATQVNSTTWRLTTTAMSQKGQMWNQQLLDLRQDFEIRARLNFGNNGGGADGITFALVTSCLSESGHALQLGIHEVQPSLVLEFDSFQNSGFNDPNDRHIALFRNGNLVHGGPDQLANNIGPNTVTVGNLKDGNWRNCIFRWTAATQNFVLNVNGTDLIRHSSDIINEIFGGNPIVYWGFTGSTGGATNQHRVEMQQYPDNAVTLPDLLICAGESVEAGFVAEGTYAWTAHPSISDTTLARPVFTPTEPTTYQLTFTDACGTISDYSFSIGFREAPEDAGPVSGAPVLCAGEVQLYSVAEVIEADTYTWSVDPPGAAQVIGGQGSPIVEVAAGNAPFTLSVLPGNACGAGAAASLLVEPQEVATSAIDGPELVNCSSAGEVYSVAGQTGSVYTWAVPPGAVILSGQGGSSIVVEFNGAFGAVSVVETNAFGCSGDTVVLDVECSTTTGVVEGTLPALRVYPNPVRDQLTVLCACTNPQLQLFDARGALVYQGQLMRPVLSVEALAPGLYSGMLTDNGEVQHFRFVKQ